MSKRGRKPSPDLLEKRRVEAELQNRPASLPLSTGQQILERSNWLTQSEKIRQKILKDFKHGAWTPDEHAYQMATLGDEELGIGIAEKILDYDDKYSREAKQIRREAGRVTAAKHEVRKVAVLEINRHLIAKIGTGSAYKIHSVARMIHDQWESLTAAQRLTGESTLLRRGDGMAPVSVRTITRWLK